MPPVHNVTDCMIGSVTHKSLVYMKTLVVCSFIDAQKVRWLVCLCCLMTPVSVRTFGVMRDHTFSTLGNHQIRSDITPHIKWAVGQPGYGHFSIPQGFVWVFMGMHRRNVNLDTEMTVGVNA